MNRMPRLSRTRPSETRPLKPSRLQIQKDLQGALAGPGDPGIAVRVIDL